MPPYATRPGDVLADRYRLVDLLSESGDGRFWRAHDRLLGRHVAIHVIRADDPRAPGLMEAARRSTTVLDPRILRVLDAEVTDAVCYVVNEWGWGTSLDIVAAGTGPLGPRRSAWLVSEVADSIATAHRQGIVHGRLNPENVLIDRTGGVRIIGLCVDAALHGVSTDDPRHDLTDLAGLLHCALTATWGGASDSIVKPAPREHGEVLRPRRVRAGVPRPLDTLCEDLLHPDGIGRHRDLEPFASSAQGISDFLADFVGDPTGMAVALQASTPPVLPEEELVVLPQVPELTPHESARASSAEDVAPASVASTPSTSPSAGPSAGPPNELPTEAGLPIFDDATDDVSWLERRTTPAPPPPPFDEPPERPLFAPEPAAGRPLRQTRDPEFASEVRPRDEYWPWDTGTGAVHVSSTTLPQVDEEVPGRSSFRLAALLSAVLLIAVGVVVAVNLGNGEGAKEPTNEPTSQIPTSPSSSSSGADNALPLDDVTPSAYDPIGDKTENDDAVVKAFDGNPATAWTTQGYRDQLGPAGIKTGVGLQLDLGTVRSVTAVDLTLLGAPTDVSLYVSDTVPDADNAPTDPLVQQPVATTTVELTLPPATTGRYLLIWLTSLPQVGGLFRGSIAEVTVLGDGGE